jgi:hypothetical protein
MFKRNLLALLCLLSIPLYPKSKCKTFNRVKVCKSLTVGGSVRACSFITPEGPLVPGILNYAVLSNQAAVTSGNNVLWASTSNSNVSSDISINTTTGAVTLPTSGLFLVTYTVRINRTPFASTDIFTVQLQQTVAGVPTNISQAAVTSSAATDGITDPVPVSQAQVTGYALINVTSAANNALNLLITIDQPGSITIPATSGTDANAQMVILQIQ